MALVKILVFANGEELSDGKGVEVPYNAIKDITDMGLEVRVFKEV